MKEPEFQKLLQDYMSELQDPKGKEVGRPPLALFVDVCSHFLNVFGGKEYEEYIRQVERETGLPGGGTVQLYATLQSWRNGIALTRIACHVLGVEANPSICHQD